MSSLSPPAGLVRPRVTVQGTGDPLPLGDLLADILAEGKHPIVWIVGGPGSGKTTALEYLAGMFGNESLLLLDEPKEIPESDRPVVATASRQIAAERVKCRHELGGVFAIVDIYLPHPEPGLELRLAPWGRDDLVEYLLAQHHDCCGSVLTRLGDWAGRRWVPEVACAIIDTLAGDDNLPSPAEACYAYFERACTDWQLGHIVSRSLGQLSDDKLRVLSAEEGFEKQPLTRNVANLLRYQEVREWLVARHIAGQLEQQRNEEELHWRWPPDLLAEVVRKCQGKPAVVEHLDRLLSGRRHSEKIPMAASLMLRLDPAWRPRARLMGAWLLDAADLAGANWPEANLARARLEDARLTGANLRSASLDSARAERAHFDHATLLGIRGEGLRAQGADFAHSDLTGAHLEKSIFTDANFAGATLRGASLSGATCRGANFTAASLQEANLQGTDLLGCQWKQADLTRAQLSGATLSQVDFREARVDFAQFDLARLQRAQFEGITIQEPCFKNARLVGSDFTASTLISPDFWNADLSGARLAEIDWRNADLRGADLRGANLNGVDFYLVDLRGARLDPEAVKQARQTGAILDDWEG